MSAHPKPKKQRRRRMTKFGIDEISLVDVPMSEPSTIAILKRADPDLRKRIALTTPVAGHAHSILTDIDGGERRVGTTSFGGDPAHLHDWVMDDAGNIILAEADGHTHGLGVLIMKGDPVENDQLLAELEKRVFSADERETLAGSGAAMPDGSFPIVSKQDLRNAIQAFGRAKNKGAVAKHIKKRARALGATDLLPEDGALAGFLKVDDPASDGTAESTGNTSSEEENKMTEKKDSAEDKNQAVTQENEDLKKRLERSESINKLPSEQREYFTKLAEDKQDEFLAKSSDEQNQEIAEAQEADKIIFKSANGDVYRQSDDPRLVTMAREREQDRKETADLKKEAADLKLRKRATEEMKNLPGTVEVKMSILKSIDNLPEDEQKPALEALQARNTEMADAFTTVGRGVTSGEGSSAEEQLDALAKARAEDKDISEEVAYGEVLKTSEGKALYQKHVEQTAG